MRKNLNFWISCLIGFIGSQSLLDWEFVLDQVGQVSRCEIRSTWRSFLSSSFSIYLQFQFQFQSSSLQLQLFSVFRRSMGDRLQVTVWNLFVECLIDGCRSKKVEDFRKRLGVLPPKLYLVVFFYQVILVNPTRITCSNFSRPSEVLLGSACCTISHVHTPWGNCNKCSSIIVYVIDSVS